MEYSFLTFSIGVPININDNIEAITVGVLFAFFLIWQVIHMFTKKK